MKKTIDQMEKLLEKHNIALPEGARKTNSGEKSKDHDERCHALKASCLKSHASSLIQEPPIIWLHLENHSLHYKLQMVRVFTWMMIPKSELKEMVLSS